MSLLDALRRRFTRRERQDEDAVLPARGEEGLGGDFRAGGEIGGGELPAPEPPGAAAEGDERERWR